MCPLGFLMLGSTLQDLPSDSPAACRSACRRRQASPRTGSPNERSWRAPGLSWSATRSSWPLPNHLPRRRPSPNRNLRWPSTASRSWTQRATTPTPAIPAVRRPAHAALQDLTPAGHSGRGNAQTPDAHTGRRTADTWTLGWHRTLDTRRWDRQAWTLDARTGHRTPAEDTDRVTTARPASGPPGPPRRTTAHWDAQPCSCGRRLRRSTAHAGSAVRPPSSTR
jgi:hypothetical protein